MTATTKCVICGKEIKHNIRDDNRNDNPFCVIPVCNPACVRLLNKQLAKIKYEHHLPEHHTFIFDPTKENMKIVIDYFNEKNNKNPVVLTTSDSYKEHEEKMKNDVSFRQFQLNEEKCALCGENGQKHDHGFYYFTQDPIERKELDSSIMFIHSACWNLVDYFAIVRHITTEDALHTLKSTFFDTKKIKKIVNKETKMLCSSDIGKNPWNK